jgi:hypothetical protein
MKKSGVRMKTAILLGAIFVLPAVVFAQGRGGGRDGAAPAPAAATPKAAAPIDLTGYWVSLVTEDWRFRMITPPKGDYASVPLNAAARTVADAWDPAKDEAAGEQCKSYGAPAIMRVPGRVHITWENDTTMRVDTDAGTQTRMFKFAAAGATPATSVAAGTPTWQGDSVAVWEPAGGGRGRGPAPAGGSLKVVTTHIRPGYLRKNGVPYSANATLTEYITKVTEPDSALQLLVVTTIVDDPQYLNQPFVTSTHFKKEPDGAKWSPSPCSAR